MRSGSTATPIYLVWLRTEGAGDELIGLFDTKAEMEVPQLTVVVCGTEHGLPVSNR